MAKTDLKDAPTQVLGKQRDDPAGIIVRFIHGARESDKALLHHLLCSGVSSCILSLLGGTERADLLVAIPLVALLRVGDLVNFFS
jgi:hypothetical protein